MSNNMSRRDFFRGATASVGFSSIAVATGSHLSGIDNKDRYKTGLAMFGLTNLAANILSYAFMRNSQNENIPHFMSHEEKLAEFEALATEDKERRAIHESGHAIAALLLKSKTFEGITIIRYQDDETNVNAMISAPNRIDSVTAETFKEMIMMSLAGKLAEEIFYGDNNYADGCYVDITHVTQMARLMVSGLGMNKNLATINLCDAEADSEIVSERTKQQIENEAMEIIESAESKMKSILIENKDSIQRLAITVLDKKTMNPEEVISATGLQNTFDERDINPLGLREASL